MMTRRGVLWRDAALTLALQPACLCHRLLLFLHSLASATCGWAVRHVLPACSTDLTSALVHCKRPRNQFVCVFAFDAASTTLAHFRRALAARIRP